METNCIFCQIVAKQIPSKVRYDNQEVMAFDDINPKAKVHILVVPKKHIVNLNEVSEEDIPILGKMLLAARDLAQELGIEETGYRVIINTKEHAGAEVDHLHFHILGGELLGPMRNT